MNNINTIFIIVGVVVVILVVLAAMSGIQRTDSAIEKFKLASGEISVFQYCAHIGKAAIDDGNCAAYNLLYGPRS